MRDMWSELADNIFKFDADRDGSLSRDEVKAAIVKHQLGPELLDSMFTKLDGNSDDRITREEFTAFFEKTVRNCLVLIDAAFA